MVISEKKKFSSLFLTEYYLSEINGIAIFSKFFITEYLIKKHDSIIVYELASNKIHFINQKNNNKIIDHIYVNAHYSLAEKYLMKNIKLKPFLNDFNLSKNHKKFLISHGWTRINFKNHYYYYYYYLKNLFRLSNINRVMLYDKILFISTIKDNYRHMDYRYSIDNGLATSFFDFKNIYINHIRSLNLVNENINYGSFLLIISNIDFVKNIFSIFYTKWTNIILTENNISDIIILTPKKNNLSYRVLKYLCNLFSIKLINDNSRKFNLLKSCTSLYIPSVTEYLPLVALEAMAFNKQIYSLYKISSLVDYDKYIYFKN